MCARLIMSSYHIATRRQTRSSDNNNSSSPITSSNVAASQGKCKRKLRAKKQEKKIAKKQKEEVKEATMKTEAENVYVDNTVQSLKLDCTIVAVNIQKQHFEPHYDAFVNFMYTTLGRHFHRSFFLKFPHVETTKPRRTLLFLEYATPMDANIALDNNGTRFNEDSDAAPLALRMAVENDTADFYMVMPWTTMMVNPYLNEPLPFQKRALEALSALEK